MNPRYILFLCCLVILRFATAAAERPNILWITSEDHGPEMGCYGDKFASTPNVDKLAGKGMIYTRAWSCAPVCAPARTTLISGMYASSTGSEHMRSLVPFPAGKKMFPQFLRETGYYCSNNAKEDYNLDKPGQVWDDSSRRGHWRNRSSGQRFFAVFNSEKSHESKIRTRPHTPVHDPAKVRVPAYHPDTPEVRRDWAQYYDIVSQADSDAGKVLAELAADGLADDTIVFYFGDHGSGMPRSKRWPYNSGLRVPLVVYIPEKFKELRAPEYKPGGSSDRLVSFVDFAPTVLSLAGVEPPAWMQGRAFLGKFAKPAPEFLHGFRGRMDERCDLVRSVTDGRYVYVRNYMPHLIYGQHLDYMWQTPTTRVWEKLYQEGKLNGAQRAFWERKPWEEFYDLREDRDELRNLADSPGHQKIKARLREAQQEHARAIRDVGFIPEGEGFRAAGGASPYDLGHDPNRYAFDAVFAAAELASNLSEDNATRLKQLLSDANVSIRYWAALGLLMRGREAVHAARAELETALKDSSPEVRITAAQALCEFTEKHPALDLLMQHANGQTHGVFSTIAALNSLYAVSSQAAPRLHEIKALPTQVPVPHQRYSQYVPRLIKDLTERIEKSNQAYFPPPESQGGWRVLTNPEDLREKGGVDPAKIADLKQWLLASDKRDFAAVMIRRGYVVLEVERGNSAKTDARRVASVSKAVCATVLAIAAERSKAGLTPKRMSFDDPAFQFIPEAHPLSDPRKATITVRQLLNHTSGICPEALGARNDGTWKYVLGHSGDTRTARLAFDPGTRCGYSTHAFAHAALVCEEVTGESYEQFAIDHLFRPLGIEHWWFQFYEGGDSEHRRHASHGLGMPARDLARIAYCMLHGGRWRDHQVIPAWFVEATASPSHNVRSPEMRWKLNPQIFSLGWELPALLDGADGRSGEGIPADARAKPGSGGQYIAFVPSLDLVLTRQTGGSGSWSYEEYLRRACAAILPGTL